MRREIATDEEKKFALALFRKPPEVREPAVDDAAPEPVTQPALMERGGDSDE